MKNKKDLRKNEIKLNNFGSKMIIINYNNKRDMDVYFPKYDWIFHHAQYYNFKNGNISCPYEPRVYNKGYTGEGKYKIKDENGKFTKCYNTWHGILRRCYDFKFQEKQITYKGSKVCNEWCDFQIFAKWYYENYYVIEGERMDLDKDILVKGNKIYSPETCVFVPQRINSLFTKRQNDRGKYPIGVISYGNKNKFRVCCQNIFNKRENLGVYENKEEAFYIYKRFKEKVIKEVADEYKDKMFIKIGIGIVSYILMIYFIIFVTVKMLNFLSKSFVGISLSEVCYRLVGCEPPPKKEKELVTRNECINDLLEDSEKYTSSKDWSTYPKKHTYSFHNANTAIDFAEMLKSLDYEVEIQVMPEGLYNVISIDKG